MKSKWAVVGCVAGFLCLQVSQADSVKIGLVPFDVRGEGSVSHLQKGILNMLTTRLASGGGLDVVLVDMASETLPAEKGSSPSLPRRGMPEACKAVEFLLAGSLTQVGNVWSLDGKLIDCKSQTTVLAVPIEVGSADNLVGAVSRLAKEVRQKILAGRQAPKEGVAGEPPSERLTHLGVQAGGQVPVYGPPPGGYPVPPGGWSSGQESIFESGAEDEGQLVRRGLNPSFIVSNQADPSMRGYLKSPDLRLSDIASFDVGDIDGDGSPETILATDEKIYIYKDVLNRGDFSVVDVQKYSKGKILGIDVADINGNGREEIYVSMVRHDGSSACSVVLEWTDGAYQPLANGLPYLLKVTTSTQEGKILLGQELTGSGFFDRQSQFMVPVFGQIHKMRWRDGKLLLSEPLPLKVEVCVLGVTFIDVNGDGVDEIAGFDRNDFLRLFNNSGGVVWTSTERLGRTAKFFPRYMGRHISDVEDRPDDRVWVPPRLVASNVTGGTLPELVVCVNQESVSVLSKLRFFAKGAIFSLSWDGLDFVENWRTREMKGYVADYQLKDLDGDRNPELVVALVYRRGTADYLRTNAALIAFPLAFEKASASPGAVRRSGAPPAPWRREEGGVSLPAIKF